jgi:hypothetical protein
MGGWGEMTQTLYAHMNKIKIKKKSGVLENSSKAASLRKGSSKQKQQADPSKRLIHG